MIAAATAYLSISSEAIVQAYPYSGADHQLWSLEKYTLTVTAPKSQIVVGETMQIGKNSTALAITWTSSDTNVATASSDGKVTGRNPGTVTITAKAANGVTASCTIRVLLNITIRQSERLPGKDKNGNVAADMITNDKSLTELYSMNLFLGELGSLYDQGPPSSSVLPPQGPTALYNKMRSLGDYFCVSDSSMKVVVNDMIDHFYNGSGTAYRNSILTQKVVNHLSTQRFIKGTQEVFIKYLNDYNGDVNAFLQNSNYIKEMNDIGRPHYDTGEDMTNGLKIAINDTWGYKLELKNFYFDGKNYSGTILYTIYDHFGLDDGDVTDENGWYLGYTGEFGSWYVLQHYTSCKNKYRPFITYIETSTAISGSLN